MEENNNNQSQNFNEIQKENIVYTNSSNNNQYKTVGAYTKEKSDIKFGKNILMPFMCGVVGTALVITTCFGVPSIRESILGDTSTQTSTGSTNTATPNYNTNLVSLSNYTDTSVGVASKVLPSIVGIQVEYSVTSGFSKSTSTASAEGSGIIIREDGYILTNNHIVNSTSTSSYYELGEATKVVVYLYNDETPYEATIIGTDAETDLAVIKIEKTGLTAATLGDSDAVQVGEFAMAIGNPLGLQSSVTSGIISAVDREVTDSDGNTYNTIQTDAAINSGNSGGALVNSNGEVIGINTLKLSGTGIEGMGFAIPINSTIDIYEQLIQYNKVKRPYIGISGIDLDEQTASRYNLVVGIYVKSVEDFSAAQTANIQAGDVIIEADGQSITTMDELNAIKNKHNIGDSMKIKLVRNGSETTVTITLTEQP